MMADLRAGLVGLGQMGRNHARVLRSLDGLRLVGVADPEGDPHGAAGGVPVVPTVEELVELGIDLCVVAVPTTLHLPVGRVLAEAGVHALVEKPLAQDSAAAVELVELFASRGLVGAVGHIERFNPAVRQMKARLEDGLLGDLYQVATRRQGPFPARIADVGVVKDLATHDIDLVAHVTGQEYERVSAAAAYRSGRPHEDLIAITGMLEGDTVVNHLVNWLSPMKERFAIASGERGCLIVDTIAADLTFYANGSSVNDWETVAYFRGVSEGDMTRYAFPKHEPLRLELEAFRDAVLGLEPHIVTMAQGLRTVAVAEAALESALSGAAVALTVE
jgi:predicted dehydrogenase